MTYDPFSPNNYNQLVAARREEESRKKRERDEEELLAFTPSLLTMFDQPIALEVTGEQLARSRLEMSAKLGIDSAVRRLEEESDAQALEKKRLGLDRKSKMSSLISKLGADEAGLSSSLLVFQPSGLRPNVSVAKLSEKITKPPLTGKPSVALLLRNVVGRGSVTSSLHSEIGVLCCKYGHVKDINIFELKSTTTDAESVRIFVRFDTVASAFRAAESLNGSSSIDTTRVTVVSFYPAQLVESRTFEPVPGEQTVAALLAQSK